MPLASGARTKCLSVSDWFLERKKSHSRVCPEAPGGGTVVNGTAPTATSDAGSISRTRVWVSLARFVTTIAGTGLGGFSGDEGPAAQAQFNNPRDLEMGPDGRLYVADTDNFRIRAIDLTAGIVTTVVGTGEAGLDATDDRLATQTMLKRPFGIEFDAAGNLYVSDTINSRILRVAK